VGCLDQRHQRGTPKSFQFVFLPVTFESPLDTLHKCRSQRLCRRVHALARPLHYKARARRPRRSPASSLPDDVNAWLLIVAKCAEQCMCDALGTLNAAQSGTHGRPHRTRLGADRYPCSRNKNEKSSLEASTVRGKTSQLNCSRGFHPDRE
jgi:hypothetical protein